MRGGSVTTTPLLQRELAQIKEDGGCTIFWLTATQSRARRLEHAENDGLIVRKKDDPRDQYPWCVFEVKESPMDEQTQSHEVTDHQINELNQAIKIVSYDNKPGDPGFCNYRLLYETEHTGKLIGLLHFQEGLPSEVGCNGITNESLLAIVIDRLRGFQSGPFACRENALALTKIEEALHWLQSRSRERSSRGVEGTHQK